MKRFFLNHSPLLMCGLVTLGQCFSATADEPGIVRISDSVPASATTPVINAAPVGYLSPHHPQGQWYVGHPPQHHGGINNPLFPPRHQYAPAPCHNPYQKDYFHPQQRGGRGLPRTGYYSGAYPVNPWYNDPRDGRIYASGATGIPMSVPLAANVEHTYNYGWGIPSSRLTPLSIMPPDARRRRQ